MLGRDESVARQQYSQQRLATKAQAILPHDLANPMPKAFRQLVNLM